MNDKTTHFWCLLSVIIYFSLISGLQASETNAAAAGLQPSAINTIPIMDPKPFTGEVSNLLSSREFFLALVSILFGLVVLFIEYKLLSKANAHGDQVLKVLIVSTIIIATMFIITAGYSSEQIAPAIGLFGTIAGYLLGKEERTNISRKNGDENNTDK